MRRSPIIPPAPVGQQGPPTRAAAFELVAVTPRRAPPIGYRDGLTLELRPRTPMPTLENLVGKRGKLDTQHNHVNP